MPTTGLESMRGPGHPGCWRSRVTVHLLSVGGPQGEEVGELVYYRFPEPVDP